MTRPKLTIVFYSTYGTGHQMAEAAAEAARAAGAEVRLRRVPETAPAEVVAAQEAWQAQFDRMAHIEEATPEDMAWGDAYFFIAPTRFGGMPSQMRAFIDTLGPLWQEGALAGKAVTAATSASNAHSGQEGTLLTFYPTLMHWGAILVPPGFTDDSIFAAGGNPYGFSTTAGAFDEAGRAALAHQTRRLVDVAARLIAPQEISSAA